MAKIPKTIHYCWFGNHPMPPLNQICFDTWQKLEGYTFKRWDESNTPNIPFVQNQLLKKNWAFASDYIRLYALYTEGGIYLDTDFEVIKNFDSLLNENLFLCEESAGCITNAAMGATKGHPFLKDCMEYIEDRFEKNLDYHISPVVTTNIYNSHNYSDIVILSSDYFYPYNPYDQKQSIKQFLCAMVTPNTIAVHHWAKSWKLHGSGICIRIIESVKKLCVSSKMIFSLADLKKNK